jgi:phosphatidylglycerol:prolipoprotein diacylglycerol transferase
MHPELFRIPFTDLTVKSYGLMVVLGFLFAAFIIKKLCRRAGVDYNQLINAGFYSFIVGVVGSRIFHVIHYRENFHSIWEMFAIWRGGLELLGGVIPAILFMIWYLKRKKLNVLVCLDIFAAALMVGVAFGRIGCFLNGCCYGMPAGNAPGVEFPYGSIPYQSQVYPNAERERLGTDIDLPAEYYGYLNSEGQWIEAPSIRKFDYALKPAEMLTQEQKEQVSHGGVYACHPVHPTQLYSSLAAFINCGLLTLFWWNYGSGQPHMRKRKYPPGSTAALMLVLYSVVRFFIETIRGDNPYELGYFTISQLLSMAMFVCGVVMFAGLSSKRDTAKN